MKKIFTLKNSLIGGILLLAITIPSIFLITGRKQNTARNEFEAFLVKEYRKVPRSPADKDKNKPADQPEIAALQDYFMTLDPATGFIPRQTLRDAYRATQNMQALKFVVQEIQWQDYPTEMGGRTRAIMYDPNDPAQKKVWAGGITGGLWYNNDITDMNSSWVPVGDFWPCLAVRCITYDPNDPMIFYIGTGEPETAMQTYRESSGLGDGIWKSLDGGQTWNMIPSTENFEYITDIAVRNENGSSVIYAGVVSGLYHGIQHQSQPTDGLFRSTNGGDTWQQVLPNINGGNVPYPVSDIAIGADGRIYVGTRPNLNGAGGAAIVYSDYGTQNSWVVNDTYLTEIENDPEYNIPGRVVLAPAPSDPNIVYALIASGFTNSVNNFNYFYCFHILRSDDKGDTWTKKPVPWDLTSGNNFATIAWHALDIAVDQNDPETLYIGGLDIHKSDDGGNYWTRLSDWSLMYGGGGPEYLHADQHIIVYKPGSSNEILFGTDGGVFYTSNGASIPNFEERNKDYTTLQFYTGAIKPTAGANAFLGGLQDNGSLRYTGTPLTINDMVSGGDGAYCFYDKNEPWFSISSIYYNWYLIFSYDAYLQDIGDWYQSGVFVNPADYDYRANTIYANACDFIGTNVDQLLRISNVTSAYNYTGTFLPLNTGTQVYFSAIKWSPFSPNGKANLFVGTQSGRLFKVQNAESVPTKTEITGTNFPVANISSIAIGGSEDTLLVTFSNYGVTSVWQTYNGGQTWENKEGNLPDMPVRWAIYHPQNHRQAMLATETGVWSTINLHEATPVWEPVNQGMANVRVDMLNLRESDNTVLAATHGRGFFTTTWDVITGINAIQPCDITISPNPTTGPVNIAINLPGSGTILTKVYDQSGKVIYQDQKSNFSGKNFNRIDLGNQPAGIYFIRITANGKEVGTKKIVRY
jgi:photosystem II stability/assembly factor-like uncharacterized protein